MKTRKKSLSRSEQRLSIKPDDLSNNNINNKDSDKKTDWWNRADIIAKIVSSIVIALGGILVGLYIQNAQISTTKSIAVDGKKLEEAKITASLLEHLKSKDSTERELALIACRQSVPAEVCDNFTQVLAKTDPDANVRKEAIKQLEKSSETDATKKLNEIVTDTNRPADERASASKAVQQRVIEKTVPNGTYAFAASANEAYEFDKDGHGLFTNYLLKGLNGEADVDGDDKMTAKELQEYLSFQVPNAFQRATVKSETSEVLARGIGADIYFSDSRAQKAGQIPVSVFKGREDTAIWGERADYGKIVALIIGVSDYSDSRIIKLKYPVSDAKSISDVIEKDKRATVQLLTNPTKKGIFEALNKLKENIKPDDLLMVYFSGHGVLGQDGVGKWLVADSIYESESTYFNSTIIKSFFDETRAKTKTLYIDACFSGADKIFKQQK